MTLSVYNCASYACLAANLAYSPAGTESVLFLVFSLRFIEVQRDHQATAQALAKRAYVWKSSVTIGQVRDHAK